MVMDEHLVRLVTEKGLDSQFYKCHTCNRDIGLSKGKMMLRGVVTDKMNVATFNLPVQHIFATEHESPYFVVN